MKSFVLLSLIGLSSLTTLRAATDSQNITVNGKLQIPGTTLKSGEYIFSVEDRLQDRAIVRIADTKGKTHEFLLAIPSEKLSATGSGQLILFPNNDSDKKVLQGWMCGSCKIPLEFVYPKAEAVKITATSAKPVLAVDPTYDKLPKNLSEDDMKVVTLWLLSPKEVTPDQKGKGVEAAKVADLNKKTETASATPPVAPVPGAGNEVAGNSQPPASPAPEPAPTAASTPAPAPAAQPAPAASATPEATPQSTAAVSPAPVAPVQTAPVETAALSAPTSPAAPSHSRRMPHTASHTYEYGVAGLLLLAGGLALQLQRRLRSSS